MRSQTERQEVKVWIATLAVFAALVVIVGVSTSSIVEVVVAGLIIAGLASLKLRQAKKPERVPVRVRVDPSRDRR